MNALISGQPFQMSLANPNPTSSKTKAGPVYRVSFEVDRDAWDEFMSADLTGMVIEVYRAQVTHAAAQEPEPTGKVPPGPWSEYSQHLHKSGWFNSDTVAYVLGCRQSETKQKLCDHFGVARASYICPAELHAWAESNAIAYTLPKAYREAK